MKKSLVFTKSIAFEKSLIDKLEDYFLTFERDGKRLNFSSEVATLIEAGLVYKQLEKDVMSGKRPAISEGALLTTGKTKLRDLIKDRVEFGETALEQPKPVKGVRIQKI